MKKLTIQHSSGRIINAETPYYMESKSRGLQKIAKSERLKNSKQNLMEYFQKERTTLTQVANSVQKQLQQSKSIDHINGQKSISTRNTQEQRNQTEESINSKRQILKGKNLSLAAIHLEPPRQHKLFNVQTTKQSNITKINSTPSNQMKPPKGTFDNYLQDVQIRSAKMNKNTYDFQNQQYFTMRQNKSSLIQESQALKQSIEEILQKNKILSQQFQRKNESESKSINQSIQQRSDSLKKSLREESIRYDPKVQLRITLFYKGFKYNYLFDQFQTKTTDDLFNFLIQQIGYIEKSLNKQGSGTGSTEENQIQQELNRICQFSTQTKNIPFDYYLSLQKLSLQVFQGNVLQLTPLYSQPLYGKKVSIKDFVLLKCIGVGGFSRVYLVRKKDNGRFYALKLIDKQFIIENQKSIIVQNERDIMAKMDSQFITPMHFAFETKYYIAFVLEYCAGGEMFYQLRKLKRLNEEDAKYYFVEICIGMAYLHTSHIVYRDIKPENILLDLQGHLLLSDFGLSKPEMSPDDFAYSFCGSPEYMAPEMLMKTGHNYLVDCYCLGALLYEMVTGLPPFYSQNTQEIYNAILTEEIQFPPYVQLSDQIKDLILQLLEKDPAERIGQNQGVIEILTHPWFEDVNFEAIVNKEMPTPFKPDPLKYNFDEEEFNKGDIEFRKQFQQNLQKEFINTDNNPNFMLKDFYFQRDDSHLINNSVRTNQINLGQIKNECFHQDIESSEKSLSPADNKKNNKGKLEVYDFFKQQDISNKSSTLVTNGKLVNMYSKQQQQNQQQDLKQFKMMIDSTKQITERTFTVPDSMKVSMNNRIKTEIGQKAAHNLQFNKQSNLQKLFSKRK